VPVVNAYFDSQLHTRRTAPQVFQWLFGLFQETPADTLYPYAINNPLNRTDPEGLWWGCPWWDPWCGRGECHGYGRACWPGGGWGWDWGKLWCKMKRFLCFRLCDAIAGLEIMLDQREWANCLWDCKFESRTPAELRACEAKCDREHAERTRKWQEERAGCYEHCKEKYRCD